MARVVRGDVTWKLHASGLVADLRKLRQRLGDDAYAKQKYALQDFLCMYFSGEGSCSVKQGPSISPMGGTPNGGKCLKVRWLLPGAGKSGGLRLAVVAFCKEHAVSVVGAWLRCDEPSDAEFSAAYDAAATTTD